MVVATSVLAPALSAVGAHSAAADPLSDKRAEAAALSQRIQQLGQEEEALSERYDQATLALQAAQQRVNQATRQLSVDQGNEATARSALTKVAVNSYVNGGSEITQITRNAQPLNSVNENLVRDEYLGSLSANESDVIDQYHLASLKMNDDRTQLRSALAAAQRQQATLAQDRQAVQASAAQLQQTLNSVNGQIATLVAQIQEQQREAAARAAQARLAAQRLAAQQLAAEQAAQAAAARAAAAQQVAASGLGGQVTTASKTTGGSSSGGSSAPAATVSAPVGAASSVAARAIAAAESRLGDWYVWGAAGPNTFDCSGLVMWSYAQAGVSLPHFSGAQYADTIHISISDVEPGDLVFPGDPGEHVAMYIGNGNIIEAPYTGAQVHIVPLSNFFVYASRVPA
jgi:cell wall-associated NlpC family hydrolase